MRARVVRDERGAALIFVAISMVALLTIAAVVIDGGQGYATHRQMQNSADAAALAGARALHHARFVADQCGVGSLPNNVDCRPLTAVESVAGSNESDAGDIQCFLITAAQAQGTGALPETTLCSSATTVSSLSSYEGVFVRVGQTKTNFFGNFTSRGTLNTKATAAATVQRIRTNDGPWMVCGNPAIGGYNFLEAGAAVTTSNPLGLRLRSDSVLRAEYGGVPEAGPAMGTELTDPDGGGPIPKSFTVHGKLDNDCGLSSNWKGLIEPDALPVTVPSNDVPAENGKKVGQYKYRDVLSGSVYGDGTEGCPDADNQVNFPSKGLDDFGSTFENCLVPVPVFDQVTDAKGPNERVHLLAIVCLRIIPSHQSTVKYYGQFVRGNGCSSSGGPTSDDLTIGGLTAVKLVR